MPDTDKSTHPENPITFNLAPGLDLMVNAAYEDDDITADLVGRCKAAITRGENIVAIKHAIERLTHFHNEGERYTFVIQTPAGPSDNVRDAEWCLWVSFEATGFIVNRRGMGFDLAAKALIALCGVIPDEDVADVRSGLELYVGHFEAQS